jgi:hypothetical protein
VKNTNTRDLFGAARPRRRAPREESAPPPLITLEDLADLPPAEPTDEEDAA